MKLKKFRIQNYKSFIDSGICNVEDGVTIFAGKNESGKTNILSALEKLNSNEPSFSADEYSFSDEEKSPIITFWFELSGAEQEMLSTKYPTIRLEKEVVASVNADTFDLDYHDTNATEREKAILTKFWDAISNSGIDFTTDGSLANIEKTASAFAKEASDGWTDDQKTTFNSILTAYRNDIEENEKLSDKLWKDLWGFVPKFVVYKTLQDDIPDDFTVSDLEAVGIKRLDNYLGTKFAKVFEAKSNPQKQRNLVKKLSTTVSDEFSAKYKQKDIELEFDINDSRISLYIYDKNTEKKGYPFHLSQRSTGLRWYFNFYIALKGEKLKNGDIILIDEPGLYLHPQAQKEMRNILNEESKNNQILFTTHSPYLIDTDNIGQIRLVEKKPATLDGEYNEISVISNKVHRCDSIDTLRPIIDAIGYSLGSELNLKHDRVLICEGVSDYYIIKALEIISNTPLNCGITHANGCGNIDKTNSLFLGLGIDDTFALVDADKAGIEKRNELVKRHIFEADHILLTAEDEKADEEIEDILDESYILGTFFGYSEEEITKAKSKLSKEIKEKQIAGKYTLAKQLYDKAKANQLEVDKIYTEKAQRLYQRLVEAINGNENSTTAN